MHALVAAHTWICPFVRTTRHTRAPQQQQQQHQQQLTQQRSAKQQQHGDQRVPVEPPSASGAIHQRPADGCSNE
ncbi:hypothetical protein FI667_g15210, partial [Globisporangium splendens]